MYTRVFVSNVGQQQTVTVDTRTLTKSDDVDNNHIPYTPDTERHTLNNTLYC